MQFSQHQITWVGSKDLPKELIDKENEIELEMKWIEMMANAA